MPIQNFWSKTDALPSHDGSEWAIWKNGRLQQIDLIGISKLVDHWLPPNTMLVGAPGANRFLPPICIPQLQECALRSVGRNLRNIIFAFGAVALSFLLVAVLKPGKEIYSLAALTTLMTLLFATDYFRSLRHAKFIEERAMFFYWLRNNSSARQGLIFLVCFELVMGASQLLLQWGMGGLDPVFQRYGMMYPSVRDGELWRILSGPYLHYSITHFSTNLALLLLIGPLAWALLGLRVVLVFVLANIVAAAVQMQWGGVAFDNFAGVSAGIYSLFGVLFVSATLESRLLPNGLAVLLGGLGGIGIISAELLSEHAATAAHLSGAMIGACFGILYAWHFRRQLGMKDDHSSSP